MIYGIISTPDIRRRATLDPGFEREREREGFVRLLSRSLGHLSIIAFNGRLFQGFTVSGTPRTTLEWD